MPKTRGKRGATSGQANGGPTIRELPKITIKTDTRDILAHATRDAKQFEDYFVVDVDAHMTETAFLVGRCR